MAKAAEGVVATAPAAARVVGGLAPVAKAQPKAVAATTAAATAASSALAVAAMEYSLDRHT